MPNRNPGESLMLRAFVLDFIKVGKKKAVSDEIEHFRERLETLFLSDTDDDDSSFLERLHELKEKCGISVSESLSKAVFLLWVTKVKHNSSNVLLLDEDGDAIAMIKFIFGESEN